MKTIETGIVVVGGGLAGLTAALEAKREDVSVTLLCKSKAGRSGNTLVSGSSLSVLNMSGGYGDSPEQFREDMLNAGAGINDRSMTDLFIGRSAEVLDMLRGYGVRFQTVDGEAAAKRPPGHSVRRYYSTDYSTLSYMNRGLALTRPLLEQAERGGIALFDDTTVLRLLTDHNGICGAVAMQNRTGELMIFRAGVVVLAAGGGCTLFSVNNNTADVSCDSYSLAYEAGALLRDMEMVQFYPTMMFEPVKLSIANPLFGDGAVLRNVAGEEFLHRYSDKGNMATRDVMSRAVKSEIDAGRGNPKYVFVDCSAMGGDEIDKKYKELAGRLREVNLDMKRDLLPIAPSAHFYIGGISIDSGCRTSVEGLLACGEAAGGLHGANRLAGVALSEAAVFGRIAGRTAARLAGERSSSGMPPGVCDQPCFRAGGTKVDELTAAVRGTIWKNASIVRSEASLNDARREIEAVADAANSAEIANPTDMRTFRGLSSLLVTARMLIEGSLLRRESRGAYYRTDFPESENGFFGNFFYRKGGDGALKISFKKYKP